MKRLTGLNASGGLAAGSLFCIIEQDTENIPSYEVSDDGIPLQKKRFEKALDKAKRGLEQLLSNVYNNKTDNFNSNANSLEENILKTHILMLSDNAFIKSLFAELEASKMNIEFVLKQKIDETVQTLSALNDPYLKERAIDIQDAFDPVFQHLSESQNKRNISLASIPQNAIIAAKVIKPSEALLIKNADVKGIIMEEGGTTSHLAIMARSWNIPLLVGVKDCMQFAKTGINVILDSDNGFAIFDPPESSFEECKIAIAEKIRELNLFLDDNCSKGSNFITKDGVQVAINANIALIEETDSKLLTAASGIGLFRSEFLFLRSGSIPSEETQFRAYSQLAKTMQSKPVIIRTFDAGADKMLGEQENLNEKNPLLGWRAVRYCLDKRQIFKTQIKAILRASVFGNIYILIPMISSIKEIIAVQELVEEVKTEFRAGGIGFKEDLQIGIMIEVPSAAITADLYAPYVDFMSIGTNDLIQYVMAADRENPKVSGLINYFEPAILRLIKIILDVQPLISNQKGYLISMCGEMASCPEALFLLLGMGLRHFSMSISKICPMKKFIAKISVKDAELAYENIKKITSADEIEKYLKQEIKKYE